MSEKREQWVGRTVDGRFPLHSYLGGSGHSDVFLTQGTDEKDAAIKLISAESPDAEGQLLRWEATRDLSHPNLIRVFEAGRCKLDSTMLLYVVEEYAEENLAQIVPERALTAEETRGMLAPVLRALQFLHAKGFVHGHVQPANVFAIGDHVKLSSDTLREAGAKSENPRPASVYDPPEAVTGAASTAADVWQLGMTLLEVLTRSVPEWDRSGKGAPEVPASMPEPFHEIVRQCLQLHPAKRWTVTQILDRLEGDRVPPGGPVAVLSQAVAAVPAPPIVTEPKAAVKWPYVVGAAAVLAAGAFWVARPKPSSAPEAQAVEAPPETPAANSRSAANPVASGSAKRSTDEVSGPDANADNHSDVVRRVIPEVAPAARRTIHGKIVVRVKVKVDAAGNVAKAKVDSGRASKYFKRLALEAAQNWKFAPAPAGPGDREWRLQFGFTRAKTEASAVRAKR